MAGTKKRGEGSSCHHCKKKSKNQQFSKKMFKCTRGEIFTNLRKRKRPCVKKFCEHCIKTFYATSYIEAYECGKFICPACKDECRCAACRRRLMKDKLKEDNCAIQNETDCNRIDILESDAPDANNIEEGQVNGLLEILDSRPDVQDIIRKGMATDFADDNAKILYVGHLIDQALTRPDVVELYYSMSHGRNSKIKSEKRRRKHKEINNISHDIISTSNISSNNNNNNDSINDDAKTQSFGNKRKKRKYESNVNSNINPSFNINSDLFGDMVFNTNIINNNIVINNNNIHPTIPLPNLNLDKESDVDNTGTNNSTKNVNNNNSNNSITNIANNMFGHIKTEPRHQIFQTNIEYNGLPSISNPFGAFNPNSTPNSNNHSILPSYLSEFSEFNHSMNPLLSNGLETTELLPPPPTLLPDDHDLDKNVPFMYDSSL